MSDFVVQGSRIFFPKITVGGPTGGGAPATGWPSAPLAAATTYTQSPAVGTSRLNGYFDNDGVAITQDGTSAYVGWQKGLSGGTNGIGRRFVRSGSIYQESGPTLTGPGGTDAFADAMSYSADGSVLAATNAFGGTGGAIIRIYEDSGSGPSLEATFSEASGQINAGWTSPDGSTVFAGSTTGGGGGFPQPGTINIYRKSGTWGNVELVTGPLGARIGDIVRSNADGSIFAFVDRNTNDVLVYQETGVGTNNWTGIQTITGVNTATGVSMAMTPDNTRLALSWRNGDVNIYLWNGSTFGFEQTITTTGATATFGEAIDITDDGTFLVVGDGGANSGDGQITMFERAGTTWSENWTLDGTSGQGGEFGAGATFAGDGSLLIVTEPRITVGGQPEAGNVYFYNPTG